MLFHSLVWLKNVKTSGLISSKSKIKRIKHSLNLLKNGKWKIFFIVNLNKIFILRDFWDRSLKHFLYTFSIIRKVKKSDISVAIFVIFCNKMNSQVNNSNDMRNAKNLTKNLIKTTKHINHFSSIWNTVYYKCPFFLRLSQKFPSPMNHFLYFNDRRNS